MVAAGEAVGNIGSASCLISFQPVVEVDPAAVGPNGPHNIGVHPGPVAVYHQVGIHKGIRCRPLP